MRSIPAFTVVGFILSAAPAVAQREVARPALTPTAGGQVLLSDVSNSYAQMEKNIELKYAKLIQEAKGNKGALEDQIKTIEQQIEKLKQAARKIELVERKLEELLPKIMEALGSDSNAGKGRTSPTNRNDQLASRLATELAKAGLGLSPDEIRDITDAVKRGGVDAARRQAEDRVRAINKSIELSKAKIKSLREQIAALDKQIEKLQQEKEKALADLRKQKEKALADAKRAQAERLIHLPTPTPAPKKP